MINEKELTNQPEPGGKAPPKYRIVVKADRQPPVPDYIDFEIRHKGRKEIFEELVRRFDPTLKELLLFKKGFDHNNMYIWNVANGDERNFDVELFTSDLFRIVNRLNGEIRDFFLDAFVSLFDNGNDEEQFIVLQMEVIELIEKKRLEFGKKASVEKEAQSRSEPPKQQKVEKSVKPLEQLVKRPEMIPELWKALEDYVLPSGTNMEGLKTMKKRVRYLYAVAEVLAEGGYCFGEPNAYLVYQSICQHLDMPPSDRPRSKEGKVYNELKSDIKGKIYEIKS